MVYNASKIIEVIPKIMANILFVFNLSILNIADKRISRNTRSSAIILTMSGS